MLTGAAFADGGSGPSAGDPGVQAPSTGAPGVPAPSAGAPGSLGGAAGVAQGPGSGSAGGHSTGIVVRPVAPQVGALAGLAATGLAVAGWLAPAVVLVALGVLLLVAGGRSRAGRRPR